MTTLCRIVPTRQRPLNRALLRPLSNWAPVLPFSRDFSQAFDDFFEGILGSDAVRAGDFSPHLNVSESAEALKVQLEVPGMSEEDYEVTFKDNVLTIKGEKRTDFNKEEDKLHYSGRSYGSFEQRIPLPVEVDADRIEASSKHGILTITLPKKQVNEPEVKKISVCSC